MYEDLRFAYDVHGNITERRIGWHTVQQLHYSAEHQLKREPLKTPTPRTDCLHPSDARHAPAPKCPEV